MKYQPPFGSSDPNAPYVDRSNANAVRGSVPPAAAIEDPQRELVRVLTDRGIVPDENDLSQVSKAIAFGYSGNADIPVAGWQATPPVAPVPGARYVVDAGAIGAWAGQGNRVATWMGESWAFALPVAGLLATLWSGGRLVVLRFDGSAWGEWAATETAPGPVRRTDFVRPLLAEPTFWVRPDGDDAHDGSANTAAAAFRTIAGALSFVQARYGAPGRRVTIRLGTPGTYDQPSPQAVPAGVLILGDEAAQASYILSGSSGVTAIGAVCRLQGLTISMTGTPASHTVTADPGAVVSLRSVTFGGVAQTQWSHILAADGGRVRLEGGIRIASSASAALHAVGGGGIAAGFGTDITFVGTPDFNVGTVVATIGGTVNISATVRNGAATGRRYAASLNGVINTSGGGATYIPGSTDGTVSTGGQYA